MPGLFVCRPVMDDKNIYAGVCWSVTKDEKKWQKDTGFITILDAQIKSFLILAAQPLNMLMANCSRYFRAMKKVFNHGHDCMRRQRIRICMYASGMPTIHLP
jgi:hypothetical protein